MEDPSKDRSISIISSTNSSSDLSDIESFAVETDEKYLQQSRRSIRSFDPSGRTVYLKACASLHIAPAQHFLRDIVNSEVDLSHRGLGRAGVRAIAIALLKNTHVTGLNLADNGLGCEGARCLSQMFEENLYVVDLNISDNEIGFKGAKSISLMLKEYSTLKVLDLSGNNIGDEGAKLIFAGLKENCYLESLNLSRNNLSDDIGTALRQGLTANYGLKSLNLSWNALRTAGAKDLSEGIKNHATLEVLDLSWNGLADDGTVFLVQALKVNTTLLKLNLTSNRITKKGMDSLNGLLKKNGSLQSLEITLNAVPRESIILLLETRLKNSRSALNELIYRDKCVKTIPRIKELLDSSTQSNQDFQFITEHKLLHKCNNNAKEWELKLQQKLLSDFYSFLENNDLRIVDVFQKFDKDGSFTVTVEEFIEGMDELKSEINITDWEIKQLAKALDNDGDGEIDYIEFTSVEKM